MSRRSLLVATAVVLIAAAVVVVALQPWARSAPQAHPARPHRPPWESTPAVAATFERPSYRARRRGPARPLAARGRLHRAVLPRRRPALSGWSRTTMQGTPVSRVYRFGSTPAHRPVDLPIGTGGAASTSPSSRAGGLHGLRAVRSSARADSASTRCSWSSRRSPGRPTTSATTTTTAAATPGTTARHAHRPPRPAVPRRAECRRTSSPTTCRSCSGSSRPGRHADFITDSDLDAVPAAAALRRAYRPRRLPRPRGVRDRPDVRHRRRATATSAGT